MKAAFLEDQENQMSLREGGGISMMRMIRFIWLVLLVLAEIIVLVASPARATVRIIQHATLGVAAPPSPGSLDPTFGLRGKVLTDFSGPTGSDAARGVAIQSDGKIIAAGSSLDSNGFGDFALARYKTHKAGSLDSTFGAGGKVTTDLSGNGSDDYAYALAIQSDGKIVAAGRSYVADYDFALARYSADGSLDGTFGTGGKVLTDFSGNGSDDEAVALAIQGDGKIVVAGISDAAGGGDFALARYNTDGSLDGAFGTGGTVLTDLRGALASDLALALATQSDGKIVAAGVSDAAGGDDFALVRYNTDGSLDGAFGAGGTVLTDFSGSGSSDDALAVAVRSDSKIVAAGYSYVGDQPDFALAGYNPDGTLDGTFGTGGKVLTDFSGNGSSDQAFALAIQGDGKIVVAGYSDANGSGDFAFARYSADGGLDGTFGTGGKVLTDFSGNGSGDTAFALAIQGDGKIVVAGYSDAGVSTDFALARYLG
jgi:uncharacterized delta-60 repeat protein